MHIFHDNLALQENHEHFSLRIFYIIGILCPDWMPYDF